MLFPLLAHEIEEGLVCLFDCTILDGDPFVIKPDDKNGWPTDTKRPFVCIAVSDGYCSWAEIKGVTYHGFFRKFLYG